MSRSLHSFALLALLCWHIGAFSRILLVSSLSTTSHHQTCFPRNSLLTQRQRCSSSGTRLYMNKARNKQADLARKLELAKQQKKQETAEATGQPLTLTTEEIKKKNDRLRFEELLRREAASALNDYSKDGYLNKEQEEEEINAQRAGIERLYEGDIAPSTCFEELVSMKTENAIGKAGAERLVPWLHKNPDRRSVFLVVLTDPRMKSPELRQTIKQISAELPKDILSLMIVINADSPSENRRWVKKNNPSESLEIFSDEKMEWMRAYTALGDNRWSMTLYIIADERVRKLARDVDGLAATRVIQNAIKSYLNEKNNKLF